MQNYTISTSLNSVRVDGGEPVYASPQRHVRAVDLSNITFHQEIRENLPYGDPFPNTLWIARLFLEGCSDKEIYRTVKGYCDDVGIEAPKWTKRYGGGFISSAESLEEMLYLIEQQLTVTGGKENH